MFAHRGFFVAEPEAGRRGRANSAPRIVDSRGRCVDRQLRQATDVPLVRFDRRDITGDIDVASRRTRRRKAPHLVEVDAPNFGIPRSLLNPGEPVGRGEIRTSDILLPNRIFSVGV